MGRLNSRQAAIVELLAKEGERSVEHLAAAFRVSDMTIRRDLAELAREGRLTRTWGGAQVLERHALDFSFREKARHNHTAKARIGRLAASLVVPGSFVFMDTGTTTIQVARFLKPISGLRVFTCSLPVVSELIGVGSIQVMMLGGTVRADSLEVYGPLTEKNFAGLSVDIAFVGTDAVGPGGGLFTRGMETARVAELILGAARKKVLVADHTKWAAIASLRYAHISDVDVVVTDDGLAEEHRKALAEAGVDLILAAEGNG
ncbi:MAG: DeoR/GlpR transcriptional regulator [Kiritimatiellae bacterium]|nr:DeoR/GlpR transcriptional regulator [Kiritimatiellia bacterium]